MGQTPVEIEFDLERQRHALTARVSRLERRVRDDLETSRDRASEHVARAKHSLATTGETAAKKAASVAGTNVGSGTAVAEHPKALVGGAAAGGFALGIARAGSDEPGPRESDSPPDRHSRTPKENHRTGLRQSLADVARGFLASQAASVVDAAPGSAKRRLRSAVSGNGKTAEPGNGVERATGLADPVHVDGPAQLGHGGPEPVIVRDTDKPPSQSHEAVVDPFTA